MDAIGSEPFQALVTDESDLPWLQDVDAVGAWELWGVAWRDVWVLDPDNRLVGVYNLTEHDLAVEQNQEDLKGMILGAAGASAH